MTSQVTQCPNCKTSFRVTDSLLSIANGSVRCGSCLHIFNATENWLQSPVPTAIDNNEPEQLINDTIEQPSLADIFDDDIFAGDDFDLLADEILAGSNSDDSDNNVVPPSADLNKPEEDEDDEDEIEFEIFEEESLPETNSEAHNDDDVIIVDDDDDVFIVDDDELISDNNNRSIINTEEDLNTPNADESDEIVTGSFSHSFLELDQSDEDSTSIFNELEDLNTNDVITDEEAWAKKLLDEEAEEATQQNIKPPPVETDPLSQFQDIFETLEDEPLPNTGLLDILNEPQSEAAPLSEQSSQILGQPNDQPDEMDDAFIFNDEPMTAGDRIGNNNSLVNNIEPEPVEMMAPADHKVWVKRMWQAAIAASVLLFASQYLLFNFDRLARDDRYRPILAQSCPLLGCQLPSLDDIGQIRSSNLMVRSHSSANSALVIDAIIINSANFKQPFPIMELQFTDLTGKIIAGRRFQPKEYLAGELAGNNSMPSNRPIHISLEIVDPGKQAVNYQLQFYPHRS